MDRVPIGTWLFILIPAIATYIGAIYYYRNYNE